MSLRPPRRIFVRKRRLSGMALALRSFAVLAFGLTATMGASLVAENWPEQPANSETVLPAVSDTTRLRPEDPVMRLAAASQQHGDPGDQGRDGGRHGLHNQP